MHIFLTILDRRRFPPIRLRLAPYPMICSQIMTVTIVQIALSRPLTIAIILRDSKATRQFFSFVLHVFYLFRMPHKFLITFPAMVLGCLLLLTKC
jgi:hypothetical protein